MQFTYDLVILKEHRRRLKIKNAQIAHIQKVGKNINSIIRNFKVSVREEIKKERKFKLNNFNVISKLKGNKAYGIRSKSVSIINASGSEAIFSNETRRKSTNLCKNFSLNKEDKLVLTPHEDFNLSHILPYKKSKTCYKKNVSLLKPNEVDKLNHTDFFKPDNEKPSLRSNRNTRLSNIINPDIRIRSSQVVITHIDMSSLKGKV
jgi:hypothetical protein